METVSISAKLGWTAVGGLAGLAVGSIDYNLEANPYQVFYPLAMAMILGVAESVSKHSSRGAVLSGLGTGICSAVLYKQLDPTDEYLAIKVGCVASVVFVSFILG